MFAINSSNQPPTLPVGGDTVPDRKPNSLSSAKANHASVPLDRNGPAPAPQFGDAADGVVVIGRGTQITGEILNCARLDIQGVVEGRISAETLVVRSGGEVKGEIRAENAEINGLAQGVIDVGNLLDVRSTGRIDGDVSYGRLAIAMGGEIAGSLTLGSKAQAPANDQVVQIYDRAPYAVVSDVGS